MKRADTHFPRSHMKAECPHPGEGSTGKCKNCLEEGHQTLECKNPRKFDLSGVEAKDPEEAWKALLEADKDSDLDLVREVRPRPHMISLAYVLLRLSKFIPKLCRKPPMILWRSHSAATR